MQSDTGANPNYDFILQDAPTKKRSLLPTKNPVLMIAAAVVLILLLVLFYGIFFGGKGNSSATGLVDILGKSGEINRITIAQQGKLKDTSVVSLAATTQISSSSQRAMVSKFLTSNGVKVDKKQIAAYALRNKSVETRLSDAALNNSLDSAYITYLKSALSEYSLSLKTAFSATKSDGAKDIIQNAYDSTQTLLSSTALK